MTTTGRSTVVGVFEDRAAAERAIDELRRAGFNDDQIGYVVRDNRGTTDTVTGGQKTLAGEGAATGAISGGVVGGVLGAAAALLIPGFGPAIAGGILATTLGGAAIGAAAGGILGALVGMGIPEEEARYYQGAFEAGRVLVTVQAPGRQREALDMLQRNGAYDATTRSEASEPNAQAGMYDPNMQRSGTYDPNAPRPAREDETYTGSGRTDPTKMGTGTSDPTATGSGDYDPTRTNVGAYDPSIRPGVNDPENTAPRVYEHPPRTDNADDELQA